VAVDLVSYRDDLEDMTAKALTEYYNHSAGLKPTMDMTRVYGHYAHLTSLESALELAAMGAPTELQRFAAEAYIGDGTKQLTDRSANLEASLTVPFDGGQVPYRQVRPLLLNEPDAARRRELYRSRCEVTERDLNPVLAELAERERALAAELGAPTVLSLYERLGFDPGGLAERTETFLADTESLYTDELDRQLRSRLGISLDQAGPSDLSRLMRAPEFDAGFPGERALPSLHETLAGLGIDLDRQPNVELDVEARPGKVPRAFCAPIRVPDRVVLVVLPQGGQEDYAALFHEAGHAEHFAHARRTLPAEERVLGDNAVTEGFAFLLEHLTGDAGWLAARLDFARSDQFVRFSAFVTLFFLRRYCAKLRYELELHSGAPLRSLPGRYAQLLTSAIGVPYPESDFLEDVDGGFYCTCYLRAWAFEAHLSEWLRERYGRAWFAQREAGNLVRELWELGQSLNADALLREVTGRSIDFGLLSDRARHALV
jgi:hypothetical protein